MHRLKKIASLMESMKNASVFLCRFANATARVAAKLRNGRKIESV